ncbi:MAG: excinuclease ABC subunit UvrA [Deltaproteobacteria bacterium]|nr:excinuclease ABC subunit UvrA [Deltaproteobacteria bacterium]
MTPDASSAASPSTASGAPKDWLVVHGAAQHNLRNVHLRLPKNRLVVFSGPSGSGKSSLAFDTLYAEGQRRYVESLSAYARQFLGQLDKPVYDKISGLSPTIAIEQKSAGSNPRSTVGTVTEIHDYLRVLWARVGVQHCPGCGASIGAQEPAQIVQEILRLPEGCRIYVFAPLCRQKKGTFASEFATALGDGLVRARVGGEVVEITAGLVLDKNKKHDIDWVVDRATVRADEARRLTDSVEQALKRGQGKCIVALASADPTAPWQEKSFSEARFCDACNRSFGELSPLSFSFNSPVGACEACKGLGFAMQVDPALVVPDATLPLRAGAIAPWKGVADLGGMTFKILDSMCQANGIPFDLPWHELTEEHRDKVLYGSEGRYQISWQGQHGQGTWGARFEGVIPQLQRRWKETQSDQQRDFYQGFFVQADCPDCHGVRLRQDSRAVRVAGVTLPELGGWPISRTRAFLADMPLQGAAAQIASELKKELLARLGFLEQVGLAYLTLDRGSATLSGGEAQRIRLASQVGSELTGVLYILDEPSIGLHSRDSRRLVETLLRLRDLGNTVLVVEHDEDTLLAADHLVDFGPGAGRLGGHVIAQGTPQEVMAHAESRTGGYLSGRLRLELPARRRKPKGWLAVRDARSHNLRGLDARIPVGVFTAVTGVSGAGKSTLIHDIVLPNVRSALTKSRSGWLHCAGLDGLEQFDKVIEVDQQPIGRTPRSNPATYTKAWDTVRQVFADLPESKTMGYGPGRFSFNVKGGRCEHCSGDGVLQVEMHFLADVYVPCEVCRGRRFNAATLAVTYKGNSIADVLEMTIDEAADLFAAHPAILKVLGTLRQVGLGYMSLGQSATTLSGGEAQRVKLSRELARPGTGKTLYVFDEPTTGLHFDDVAKLLGVLQRLVDRGNSVLVIEHNLDVVLASDWVIDLGPEGGGGGGQIVAEGTPEAVATAEGSHTGRALRDHLSRMGTPG